jgi:hypothetical protein
MVYHELLNGKGWDILILLHLLCGKAVAFIKKNQPLARLTNSFPVKV